MAIFCAFCRLFKRTFVALVLCLSFGTFSSAWADYSFYYKCVDDDNVYFQSAVSPSATIDLSSYCGEYHKVITDWSCKTKNGDTLSVFTNPYRVMHDIEGVFCIATLSDECEDGYTDIFANLISQNNPPNKIEPNGLYNYLRNDLQGSTIGSWGPYNGISGETRCSATGSGMTSGDTGNPSSASGNYCWARITEYNGYSDLDTNNITSWVYIGSTGNCENQCTWELLPALIRDNQTVRNSLFNANMCVADNYSVTYDCGNAAGTPPTDSNSYNVSNQTATLQNYQNYCNTPINSAFAGWNCNGITKQPNNTINVYNAGEDIICTAQWNCANGYSAEPSPLQYYVNNLGSMGQECSNNGCSVYNNDLCCDNQDHVYWNTHWKQIYTNITINGLARVSNTGGNLGDISNDGITENSSGSYCWCKTTGYDQNGEHNEINYLPWVLSGIDGTGANYAGCSHNCAKFAMNDTTLRATMFSGSQCVTDEFTITLDNTGAKYYSSNTDTEELQELNSTLYTIYNTGVYEYASRQSSDLLCVADTELCENPDPQIAQPIRQNHINYYRNYDSADTTKDNQENVDCPFMGYYSKNNYNDNGYCDDDNGESWCTSASAGTQYIDSNGYITQDGINTSKNYTNNNQIWYAKWCPGTPRLSSINRVGYTLDGWFTERTGGNQITTGTEIRNNLNLYAHWTSNTYEIKYDLNDGTYGELHPTNITYDQEFTISNPTRYGYIFNGWNITDMDGTTHYYGTNTTIQTSIKNITDTVFKNLRSVSGTVTFAAQWQPQTYHITYNCNDDNRTITEDTVQYYKSFVLNNGSSCNKNGYNFSGWDCTPGINADQIYTAIGDTTCTALWSDIICACTNGVGAANCSGTVNTNNKCDYTWDCNDGYYGNNSIQNAGVTYTAGCTKCPDDYPDSDIGATTENQCYTIQYQQCTQSDCVNSDPNGCDSAICAETCNCENLGSYKLYPNGDINGDSTPQTCTKEIISLTPKTGHFVSGTESCPINKHNVIYNCNTDDYDSTTPDTQEQEYNSTVILPTGDNNTCKKGQLDFEQWYCDGVSMTDNQFTMPDSDVTCNAQWASLTCGTGYYKSGDVCVLCPNGYRDGGIGLTNENQCVGEFVKYGNQITPKTPENCASIISIGSCNVGSCKYKQSYDGTIIEDCTPDDCERPISVSANPGSYVNIDSKSCSLCDSAYPLSSGGEIGGGACYKEEIPTCIAGECDVPEHCQSAICSESCSCSGTPYRLYADGSIIGNTTESCQKSVVSVTAMSGYYVNGNICSKCPSSWDLSESGNTGGCSACYKNATRNCQQKKCSNPDPVGCYKAVCESSCQCDGGTYIQHANDTCDGNGITIGQTVETCTKGVAQLFAYDGYHVNGIESCPLDGYNIEYTLNGGEFEATTDVPTTYTINSATVRIPTPRRSEYRFIEWCDDEELSENCSVTRTIPRGSKGDKAYYAKWEFECESGKWLHIGDERVCLYTEQNTHPSLKVNIKNKSYYANLSEDAETPIHSESNKKMHIKIGNATYNVYDNSVVE